MCVVESVWSVSLEVCSSFLECVVPERVGKCVLDNPASAGFFY